MPSDKLPILLGSPFEYKSETGKTDYRLAQEQFRTLKQKIESHNVSAKVISTKRHSGLFDFVYVSNSALIINDFAIIARYSKKSRRGEEVVVAEYLKKQGIRCIELPDVAGLHFEGAGDCRFSHHNTHLWIGYGTGRSTRKGIDAVRRILRKELGDKAPIVHAIHIIRPVTFHIDLCLLPLPDGRMLYHRSSFSAEAQTELYSVFGKTNCVNVPVKYHFACNSVVISDSDILAPMLPFPEYKEWFQTTTGMNVDFVDVSQFHIGKGSVSCMCLRMFAI
jgi:N-dimethylarginine dimethylaminohydrolase